MAAGASAQWKISGLKELDQALTDLPKLLQAEIIGAALAGGGEVIRSSAERRIRKRSGRTAKALRVEVQTTKGGPLSKAGGAAAIGVEPKRQHVLRFLEFGTKAHPIPKERKRKSKKATRLSFGGQVRSSVNHPGQRPQAPLTKALADDGQRAIKAFADKAWAGIEAFVAQRNLAGGKTS